MNDKLLALLMTIFVGVDKVILQKIADKKAVGITDESQLQTIADGVTIMDIMNSEADRRATEASKTAKEKAISEYEATHKLKDGKVIETPAPPATPPASTNPEIAALTKQIQDLTGLIGGVVTSQSVAEKKANAKVLFGSTDIPEKFIDKYLNRLDFESETSIEDQVKSFGEEFTEMKQGIIDKGIEDGNFTPGHGKGPELKQEEFHKMFNEDSEGVEQSIPINIPGVDK